MNLKLLKLLFDYSKQGKIVDINYIDKLIEIVVSEKGLNEYVKWVKIMTEDDYYTKEDRDYNRITLAIYDGFDTIRLYANNINKVLEYYTQYFPLFTSIERYFFQNIIISQTVLHELEHANQEKMIDEDNEEESLETTILKLSVKRFYFEDIQKLIEDGWTYQEIEIAMELESKKKIEKYKINPSERLAEIKSYQQILDILKMIKDRTPNLIDYEETTQMENLLRGYEEYWGMINVPTYEYILDPGALQKLSKFHAYLNNYDAALKEVKKYHSLGKRLTYGLPIDQQEYQYCQDVVQMSKKYNGG